MGWQERWFEVSAPGRLHYYKSDTEASRGGSALGVIDLRLVLSLKQGAGSGRDMMRLDLELADRRFKLKAASQDDARAWLDALQGWRDFAIDSSIWRANNADVNHGASPGASSRAGARVDEEQGGDVEFVNPTLSPILMADDGTRKRVKDAPPAAPPAKPESPSMPATLEGVLQKKKSHRCSILPHVTPPLVRNRRPSLFSSAWRDTWTELFFKVHSSDASLEYFRLASDSTPKGSIDLRLVVRIDRYTKADNPRRFSINLGEQQQIKLRARTAADAERWITGLEAWKDYFLMNCESYEPGTSRRPGAPAGPS